MNYAVCLRQTDGSPVVRLGEGSAADLSRDGKWALANVPTTPPQLVLYPTGAGEPRQLERGGLVSYESAQFFPDGKRIVVCGHEDGKGVRCYVQDVAGGKPRPVTPEGTSEGFVSPDGRLILVKASGGALVLYPVDGGEPRPVAGRDSRGPGHPVERRRPLAARVRAAGRFPRASSASISRRAGGRRCGRSGPRT